MLTKDEALENACLILEKTQIQCFDENHDSVGPGEMEKEDWKEMLLNQKIKYIEPMMTDGEPDGWCVTFEESGK